MKNNLFSPRLHRLIYALTGIALLISSVALVAHAQSGRPTSLIRDTEIENYLKEWAYPVIKAADLDPDSVNIILVQDDNINAFVAGGQNVFIYSGLLTKSKNPGEVIGVLAHELGHIRGGHLVRTKDAMENASYEAMLGTILGIGAAILSGDGGAAAAVSAGTSGMALNRLLAFSRIQESSADQAAVSYLERARLNPGGLVSFMERLADEELLPLSQQSEYVRTHPLTRDRVESLKAGTEKSSYTNAAAPTVWQDQHDRMIAKLVGFVTPDHVIWNYSDKDASVPARYARAIAAYRQNRTDEALRLIDGLLATEPKNAYFLELKGQMLGDFGRIGQAVPFYRQASELQPDAGLIRTAYAHSLIETAGTDPQQLEDAIRHLKRAQRDEPRSTRIHRLLAIAYGKIGDDAMAKLHLAEEALLQRRPAQARTQAEAAAAGLRQGSPGWIRAQDIITQAALNEEKSKGSKRN
ncbi:MAG: M48 family metalloprotease [Alphaproteobacteria bacterium]|nr:M48 family metalloprotease [Alphaproteobacteria bacterium]